MSHDRSPHLRANVIKEMELAFLHDPDMPVPLQFRTQLHPEYLTRMDQKITNLLEELIVLTRNIHGYNLGFGPNPGLTHVYVGEVEGPVKACWYFLDAEMKQVPIEHPSLVGRVTGVRVREVMAKGKPTLKLEVQIASDRTYLLRSGIETFFSTGLLSCLLSLPVEVLKNPLRISVSQGEENEKVIFASLSTIPGDKRVVVDKEKQTKGKTAVLAAVETLRERLGNRDPEPTRQQPNGTGGKGEHERIDPRRV